MGLEIGLIQLIASLHMQCKINETDVSMDGQR